MLHFTSYFELVTYADGKKCKTNREEIVKSVSSSYLINPAVPTLFLPLKELLLLVLRITFMLKILEVLLVFMCVYARICM